MAFYNFRKETSERSDSTNWAKQLLIDHTPYFYDSIEGCNENSKNVVTHLMERARVDFDAKKQIDLVETLIQIVELESEPILTRKINFAHCFGINLSYVLYCNETQSVWLFEIKDLQTLTLQQTFSSYEKFSQWIASIKEWSSSKYFRESEDLPLFDKLLRKAGCAWPTNIDCFISNQDNQPIAVLEFQNAKTTSVKDHCNNEFFLCKQMSYNKYGYPQYHDDIRRWLSQEIIRVQSGLRFFVVTWAQGSPDFILKEIDIITFPELPFSGDWKKTGEYKRDMHQFILTRKQEDYEKICNNYQSYNLVRKAPLIMKVLFNPPLSQDKKTFPYIYYKYKKLVQGKKEEIPNYMNELIENK